MMLMGIVSIDGQLQGQKRITSKQWTREDTLLTEEMRRSAVSLSFASAVIGQAARIREEDWRNCWDGRGYGDTVQMAGQLRQETKRTPGKIGQSWVRVDSKGLTGTREGHGGRRLLNLRWQRQAKRLYVTWNNHCFNL
jgi:hypothetical protein